MCVNFCGTDGYMPKQFLNCPQVGTVPDEVCGKGVAESVWAYTFTDFCFHGLFLNNEKDHLPAHFATTLI